MKPLFHTAAVLLICAASSASGQLVSNPAAPARVGHYHLNVTSIEEHKRFWVDMLGGTAIQFGGIEVVRFPDAFIFLTLQRPTGPTRGTAFDHIGFAVPDVPTVARKLAAAGYKETTSREPALGAPPAQTPSTGTSAVYGRFAYFLGPDGESPEDHAPRLRPQEGISANFQPVWIETLRHERPFADEKQVAGGCIYGSRVRRQQTRVAG